MLNPARNSVRIDPGTRFHDRTARSHDLFDNQLDPLGEFQVNSLIGDLNIASTAFVSLRNRRVGGSYASCHRTCYFTAPIVSPRTMKRWPRSISNTAGIVEMIEAAAICAC